MCNRKTEIEKTCTQSMCLSTCTVVYIGKRCYKPLTLHSLPYKNYTICFVGGDYWDQRQRSRYEFLFLASRGGGVVIPDMVSTYISLSPGRVLRFSWVDSLLTVSAEPGVDGEACVTPTTHQPLCNSSWGFGMGL